MLANRGKRDELFLISAKIKIENSKLIFDISAIKRKKKFDIYVRSILNDNHLHISLVYIVKIIYQ